MLLNTGQEYLELGTTPCDEDCAQVSQTENYMPRMRAEAEAFKNQLIRMHGTPPDGAGFRIKRNAHDFGTYLDVVVYYQEPDEYDENDEPTIAPTSESMDYAFKVESNLPEFWDNEAKKELEIK